MPAGRVAGVGMKMRRRASRCGVCGRRDTAQRRSVRGSERCTQVSAQESRRHRPAKKCFIRSILVIVRGVLPACPRQLIAAKAGTERYVRFYKTRGPHRPLTAGTPMPCASTHAARGGCLTGRTHLYRPRKMSRQAGQPLSVFWRYSDHGFFVL